MPTPAYNRYGMPNGSYAQGAQAAKSGNREVEENPIAAGLNNDQPNPGGANGQVPADPNVAVTRTGAPNLGAVSPYAPSPLPRSNSQQALQNVLQPPHLTGRYAGGDFGVPDATQVLGNAYQTYLHRPGSPAELQGHLRNQGLNGGQYVGQNGLNAILSSIANSPEALNYQPGAPDSPVSPRGTPYGDEAGFDTNRLNDLNDHEIKYEYGRYAQDHAGLKGQALRDAFASDPHERSLFPGMQAQGADELRADPNDPWQDVVGDVGGEDRIQFINKEQAPQRTALLNALGATAPSPSSSILQQVMQTLATQNALR